MSERPSVVLGRHRAEVREIAVRYGLSNPRVFGSVARGEDGVDSDIDLVVDPGEHTSLFDLGGAYRDLTALLGHNVDLITSRQVPEAARARVLGEAVPV
jgi:predicted nucleotidyltransferase